MQVATWNVQWAARAHRSSITERLASLDADVLVVTEGVTSVLPSDPSAQRAPRAAASAGSAPVDDAMAKSSSPPVLPGDADVPLTQRHDALRATFTVEGEILARWGITPALPRPVQDQVLDS